MKTTLILYTIVTGFLFIFGLSSGCVTNSTNSAENKGSSGKAWKSVFDGKTLGDWEVTDYAGRGEVSIDENGSLVLGMGIELTGVHLSGGGDYPTIDYEIALQAKRGQGGDFFCGLTFPY
ncbi:MAG: hypothetical protein VCA18_01880, partial [Opitutales bacterium]